MGKILNYDLRPCKQIERKIILEILNELRFMGYPISQYRYIGMPSFFYYDCILFYKYLYIDDMLGFESKQIPKRMEFNKPYDFIKIKNGSFSQQYSEDDFDKKVILWLDYTSQLDMNKLEDIRNIVENNLKRGSVLIITIPSEYPLDEDRSRTIKSKITQMKDYLNSDTDLNQISQNTLSSIYFQIVKNCVDNTLYSYKRRFHSTPLFNLEYKDGCNMVSFGFIIDRKNKALEVQKFLKNRKSDFCSNTFNSYKIELPILTHKERQYINKMQKQLKKEFERKKPCLDNVISQFEIKEDDIRSYLKHSKYHPNYIEGIV